MSSRVVMVFGRYEIWEIGSGVWGMGDGKWEMGNGNGRQVMVWAPTGKLVWLQLLQLL